MLSELKKDEHVAQTEGVGRTSTAGKNSEMDANHSTETETIINSGHRISTIMKWSKTLGMLEPDCKRN
jgi:hypothetical protein